MEFYQKLQKLRKEHGMSQEELATQLGVSRQAVSKWENGQGFPETDKLLMIGNLFGVSMDYLLKNEPVAEDEHPATIGYYASRETVDGYLILKNRKAKRIALGVAILILSPIFSFFFANGWDAICLFATAAVGVAILVSTGFIANPYKQIEQQPLMFDPAFLTEFKNKYYANRKRYGSMIVLGIILIIMGVAATIFAEEILHLGVYGRTYNSLLFIFAAAGVASIIIGGSALSAGNIIANNAEHIKSEEENDRYGWIWGLLMPLAAMAFLALGFIGDLWHPGWLVFPVAAILGAGITGGLEAHHKKK